MDRKLRKKSLSDVVSEVPSRRHEKIIDNAGPFQSTPKRSPRTVYGRQTRRDIRNSDKILERGSSKNVPPKSKISKIISV